MKRILLIVLVLGMTALYATAQRPANVPAYPGVIIRMQPDGDSVHVFMRGDERKHFMMTVDGWQIEENNKGKLCYCKLRRKGSEKVAVPTCRQARDAEKRSRCEKRWLEKHGIRKF